MKVLWVINNLTTEAYDLFYGIKRGGLWVDNYLLGLREEKDLEIVIVTSSTQTSVEKKVSGNVVYYLLPGGDPIKQYRAEKASNISIWNKLISDEKPDLIQIWGTESSLGLAAQLSSPNIKSVVLIQGVVESLQKYCVTGISLKEMINAVTLRGLIRGDSLLFKKKNYGRNVLHEHRVLNNAHGFIYENLWCKSVCERIAPNAAGYKMILPIADDFISKTWEGNRKNTIMCPFMYDSFKGYHLMLKALSIIVKFIPDACLLLPGDYRPKPDNLLSKMKQDDYSKMVWNLIDDNQLENHIQFLGYLTPSEMAENMQQSTVFVMCSTIENHASTLKEAMALGMPCVASDVGGVTEYAVHNKNALVYRTEDYELLAHYVVKLLKNKTLASKLGKQAKMDMHNYSRECGAGKDLYKLYNEIISQERKA